MRYLYYCNSTYQLINILNLHWNRKYHNFEEIDNYSADLIMLNAYDDAYDIFNILKENHIFDDIKIVNRVKTKGKFHTLKVIKGIVFPSSFLSKEYNLSNIKNKYDYIVTPKFNRLIAAIWQVNKNTKLQIYEDGVGTYIGDLCYGFLPKTYKLIYRLFNNNRSFDDIDTMYLNNIDLYSNNIKLNLKQMPLMNKDFIDELLKLFKNYSIPEKNDQTIYYLSQIMFENTSKNNVDRILNVLYKYNEDVIFFPHPRNPVKTDYQFCKGIEGQIWELKILNTKKVDDICLIASHSTACFTPFLLYRKKPYVIFYYNMIDDNDIISKNNFDDFVIKLKNMYQDSSKIMTPKTIDEFEECLKIYYEKREHETK